MITDPLPPEGGFVLRKERLTGAPEGCRFMTNRCVILILDKKI